MSRIALRCALLFGLLPGPVAAEPIAPGVTPSVAPAPRLSSFALAARPSAEMVALARASMPPKFLTAAQRTELGAIASACKVGDTKKALDSWKGFVVANGKGRSIEDLVAVSHWVLRTSRCSAGPELMAPAETVAFYTELLEVLREYQVDLRDARASVGKAQSIDGPVVIFKTAPPGPVVTSRSTKPYTSAELDAELARVEGLARAAGADKQMWQLQLQDALQKQQQAYQMVSSLMKSFHDMAMSIISNIKG